ncbi:hypothetical protein GCM10022245_00560 [Streptomyces mayteni]
MRLAQGRPGIDAQFIGQLPADAVIGFQGVLLPLGPVQGDHQLPGEALPQPVFGAQLPQLGDQRGPLALSQPQVHELFERGHPLLVESGRRRLDDMAGQAGERRSAPQLQSRGHRLDGVLTQTSRSLPLGERDGPGEPLAVDLLLGEIGPVPRPLPDHQIADRRHRTPQSGNGVVDLATPRGRWSAVPQDVDQGVHGQHATGVQQQDGQQPLLPRAGHGHPPTAGPHLQWPKEPDFQSAWAYLSATAHFSSIHERRG